MASLKRVREGEQKPFGWSWYSTPGAYIGKPSEWRWGIFGGTLYIHAGTHGTEMNYDFKEWFFRIPVVNVGVTVCRIRPLGKELVRG